MAHIDIARAVKMNKDGVVSKPVLGNAKIGWFLYQKSGVFVVLVAGSPKKNTMPKFNSRSKGE
jgi:hypothetical protein